MVGAVERMRPQVTTVVAIMAGLLPIPWAHGVGSEMASRIAVAMIEGTVSSTLVTAVFIPAFHGRVRGGTSNRAGRRPGAAAGSPRVRIRRLRADGFAVRV